MSGILNTGTTYGSSITLKDYKMKKKFLQYTFLACSLMVLVSACRKDPFSGTETKESGKTFVWITEAQTNNQFFDVFTDIKPVTMFTVRRDAASKADLQKSVTVTLKAMDQSYIDASNTANGTNYTLLPASIYTLVAQPGVAIGANSDLTLSFAGGDFAKNIIFNIDGSKVDLSKQYAVAYVITNFGGFSKKHSSAGISQDTILATVAIKNRWDGVYSIEGTMSDVTDTRITDINSVLGADGPMQYELQTVSGTTNTVYDNNFIQSGYNWWGSFPASLTDDTPGISRYGSFSPVFTFDPATNKVVGVVNYYGQPASNKRFAKIDPTGENVYDPATKTIKVKWFMFQPGITGRSHPAPLGDNEVRTSFNYTFTYIGSR